MTKMMTIDETADWLRGRDHFLILTHKRPDGDTLGCASGLACGLLSAGKTAYILNNPEATARYAPYVEKYWAPEGYVPDFVIVVDAASPELFCIGGEVWKDKLDFCIDHHPSNTRFAPNLCLDTSRAACGEIIYELLLALNGRVTPDAAAALYVAVSTDTGCFAYANTTSNTLRVASELVDAGAPIADINKRLFRTKAKSRVMLEGMITSGMEYYFGGTVAVSTITKEMLAKTGADENDLDDVAAIPGGIEGVEVGITIRELSSPNDCKVSVRTTKNVDANALCALFGGGGHAMAAGCTKDVSPAEMKKLLIDALRDRMPAVTASQEV